MNDVDCKYSNGIVPYMYGEVNGSAATEFESHLLDCQACTDEFAALSVARYEVYDWKKLEFDPLETPMFEIPYEQTTASWIEKLRAAVAGWAIPSFALAGAAVLVVFGAVFVATRDTDTHVALKDNTNVPVSNASTNQKPDPIIAKPAKDKEPEEISVKPESQTPRPVLVKETAPKHSSRGQQTVVPRSVEAKSTTNKTREVPRLNEFNQDEDKSLRLAELFEDIDTSE